MGMAEQQLSHHAVHHILHGEAAPVALNVRVEHHLHQHVAQFLPQHGSTVQINGLRRLIALLQQPSADGRMGLHPVPGAALRGAEDADDLQQILVAVVRLLRKIYHSFSFIAIGFDIFSLLKQKFCQLFPLG